MNSITLMVDSYYEYFLTMLGWTISNGLWDLLTQTGLFATPFLAHIIHLFLKVREQGDDEGNKGRLLARWLENKLYVTLLVMLFTCFPALNVSFSILQFNEKEMSKCGRSILKPSATAAAEFSEFNGKTVSLPLWWGMTYSLGKGMTHGAISLLSCKPDLRQVRFEVQNTQIANPVLRQEINDFVAQCYVPTRTKFKRYQDQFTINEALSRDVDWIGSSVFLNTGGLYDSFYATSPNPHFPYDPNRDAGRPSHLGGGFPNCKQWWADSSAGLKARVAGQVDPGLWMKIRNIWTDKKEYEDAVIRQLVSPQNMEDSSGNRYRGYNDGSIQGSDSLTSIVAAVATAIGQPMVTPVFDTIKQSLPMIQGFISMSIIIGLPMIMVLSGYSLNVMVSVGVIQISVFFLSFWWELARWFDWWFLKSVEDEYDWGFFIIGNDDVILKIVVATMFLVLPTIWFVIMSWAGFKGATQLGNAINKSADSTGSATKEGMQEIKQKAEHYMNKSNKER